MRTITLAPLLVHHEDVPPVAREAIRDALAAPQERRHALLEHAATVLHRETAVDCADARELVGLPAGNCL